MEEEKSRLLTESTQVGEALPAKASRLEAIGPGGSSSHSFQVLQRKEDEKRW